MKKICVGWTAVFMLLCGCRKNDLIKSKEDLVLSVGITKKRFPIIPRVPLLFSDCVYSLDDLTTLIGTTPIQASAVILESGMTITTGADLQSIIYQATPETQSNSLFRSTLAVSWRYPGEDWRLNTSDVWSLGCVYSMSGITSFTNLLKDGRIIQINTCFFWPTNVFTHERISYVVIQ